MVLRPLTLTGIILSIVTGISLGVFVHVMTRNQVVESPAGTLSNALQQVSTSYVEEVSEEELLGRALNGMMHSLDDHSNFLNEQDFEELRENTSGQFGGIGIELGLVDDYFTVISPLDDTPAAIAGVQAGDRIMRIDDEPVKGLLLTEIIHRLRGQPGSGIKLRIKRKDAAEVLDFDLTRSVIQVTSVRGHLLQPGFGYVRISQFQDSTGDDLLEVLEKLETKENTALQGLVVDLRNNPGGTLQSSVEVADHFLEQGLIVYTEGRLKSSFAKYRATKGDLLGGMPIVVLINGGSASASEIVAGALQDHGRAKLMGAKSYGKGSVQSVFPLNDEQALKITTAYYFTPKGRSIHETGIEPDVAFEGNEEALLEAAMHMLKMQSADLLQAQL